MTSRATPRTDASKSFVSSVREAWSDVSWSGGDVTVQVPEDVGKHSDVDGAAQPVPGAARRAAHRRRRVDAAQPRARAARRVGAARARGGDGAADDLIFCQLERQLHDVELRLPLVAADIGGTTDRRVWVLVGAVESHRPTD